MLRRLLGLGLALVLGATAWQLRDLEQVRAPWLDRWALEHPGPRAPDAEALERVATEFAIDRRTDLFGLTLGLGVAALALALVPKSWLAGRGAIGATLKLLATGAVVSGGVAMTTSLSEVSRLAEFDRWTLSDDSLSAYVGPLAETLREWRETIPVEEAVIVVGTNDFLLSRVGWALHPRPVHPVVLPLPVGVDLAGLAELARELPLGRDAPGRWLIDLDALATGREALVRVDS